MTEKNYNPQQKEKTAMKKQEKVQKAVKQENFKTENPVAAENKAAENKIEEKKEESKKPEAEEKKQEVKKPAEKPKKTKAVVNGFDLPISAKQSEAICRFIKRKRIPDAIRELEQVARLKKPVPMKGEIPHRKGEIMSGRFPQKAALEFIILLKSLASNSIYHGIEEPIITEAFANIGSRPFGRKGIRRKRTHVIIAAESKIKEKKK